jgi:hypothetical protein|tara:strand:- start:4040 stop:4735 length:696 start_codon:yes stop_codon:yes gene_type:complete
MAKISSYNLDTTVSKNDKVIGTDSGGSTTKNFKLEDIAGFLNTSSLINVNGQIVYKFKNSSSPSNGEFTKTGGSGNFSDVTAFKFSHGNTNDQDIETYLNYFQGLRVMLTQTDDQNNFGLYNVDSITSTGEGATFSTFTVTFIEGNGAMISDKHYAMAYSPKGQTDKNFVSNNISFTANTAQTITHNLNKFPSVTIVDSAGSHVFGDIQHVNTNSFTITFTSSFTGKVYVN